MDSSSSAPVRHRAWWLAGAALLLALSGLLVFALTRGVEVGDELPGVQRFALEPSHVDGTVPYEQSPPVGGPHSPIWAECTGTVYPFVIPSENVVHSLEHGAVWVTYDPSLPREEVSALESLVTGLPYSLMSPYPGLGVPVSLQSWNRQLKLSTLDLERVEEYLNAYRQGSETPEEAAPCTSPEYAPLDLLG